MKRLPLTLLLLLALALPALAGTALYRNARYGFQVQVPDTFLAQPEPANGDGRTFLDRAHGAELLAWGWNNAMEETLQQAMAAAKEEAGGPVAYEAKGKNWYVLSWTDGKNIVYQKAFLGKGSGAGFRLTYPVARKAEYDGVVKALEKSFRPGDLSSSH